MKEKSKNEGVSTSLNVGRQSSKLDLRINSPKILLTKATDKDLKLKKKSSKSNLKKKTHRVQPREPMNFSLLPPIQDTALASRGISLASPPKRRKKKRQMVSVDRMDLEQEQKGAPLD